MADFEVPQIGKVSLISFDPHPLLPPHPYIEWFSQREDHYRIELDPEDAQILSSEEVADIDRLSQTIHQKLQALL